MPPQGGICTAAEGHECRNSTAWVTDNLDTWVFISCGLAQASILDVENHFEALKLRFIVLVLFLRFAILSECDEAMKTAALSVVPNHPAIARPIKEPSDSDAFSGMSHLHLMAEFANHPVLVIFTRS
jgi:hypothetical protein